MQMKGMQQEELSSHSDQAASAHPTANSPKEQNAAVALSSSSQNGHRNTNTDTVPLVKAGPSSLTASPTPDPILETPAELQISNEQGSLELGGDVASSFGSNQFWPPVSQQPDDVNIFQSVQMNGPIGMQNYGLNNNNSFPQAMPFGSIGQSSYMPANNSQYGSAPGIAMMNSMPMNNMPMGGYNYQQACHNQNQRRAITAQHGFNSMGQKNTNARFPWGSQHSQWPNNSQASVSPWTVALQQQKAMNRGGNGLAHHIKKPPMSQPSAINNLIAQQKIRRGSPVPGMKSSGVNGGDIDTGSLYSVSTQIWGFINCN